jgi:nitroimidazol reductase NimA-like FMN-containing flavoprotein (pyridoxamine 5'-phosphate oxidase superfamily)
MSVLRRTSAWSLGEVEQFLRQSRIPLRLACLSGGGAPQLCSLWFLYDEGALWCATRRDARLVSMLRKDSRCAFEVAGDLPPYRGVRGQGRALLSETEGPALLLRLIDRYLDGPDSGFARWLIGRQDNEVAIRIEPAWMTSWDFSRRMAGS